MGCIHRGCLAVVFVWIMAGTAVAESKFMMGWNAASQGEYGRAFATFLPLAQAGDRRAQYHVALLYEGGKGVHQDFSKALLWYELAAKQGYTKAQDNLAAMYFSGRGTSRDLVSSYLWAYIADLNGSKSSKVFAFLLQEKMTVLQVVQAKALARSCLETAYEVCS